jgi:hypothetical protein
MFFGIFFFIKRYIINSTFHIKAVFDGFGMGRTEFFFKCRLTCVTLALSNTGHPQGGPHKEANKKK